MATRIGFLIDLRLFRTEDGFAAEVPIVRFALRFRDFFDEVVLIARVFDDAGATAPYPIPDDVRVVPLPAYPRISSLYLAPQRYWLAIERALRQTLPDLDALWLNFGHPVSARALALSRRHEKLRPFAVIRGAYERDAALRTRGPGFVQRFAGAVMQAQMRAFTRRALERRLPCFAFGAEMTERLEAAGLEVDALVLSLLTQDDLGSDVGPDPGLACDLLVVSRLVPEKGIDVLLDALPGLCAAGGRPATLRIAGSGDCEPGLREQADRLGLRERVHFDGHVAFGPELFARYKSAGVLVVPSRTEGVPAAACEALAFGCPVIATSVGGLPELISDAVGVLVPPEDPQALRSAASELLADSERLRAMSAQAQRVGRELTFERQVRRIAERVLDTSAES